eukprot:jgi/Botrbrau1/6304/Bobra.0339s0015.1
MGGQRLAQCVVYLNTLAEEAGGATRFQHAALGGLSIQPRQGDALVFLLRDGRRSARLPHDALGGARRRRGEVDPEHLAVPVPCAPLMQSLTKTDR